MATAQAKRYYAMPFDYVAVDRDVYRDRYCTDRVDESVYKKQLKHIHRELHDEYPEECMKSYMSPFDKMHPNEVHSRIGEQRDEPQSIIEERLEDNHHIMLQAFSRPEDCKSKSGAVILSATTPNCVPRTDGSSSSVMCSDTGYDIFNYEGSKCEGEYVSRVSYSLENFCDNFLPVDTVIGFVGITCPSTYTYSTGLSNSSIRHYSSRSNVDLLSGLNVGDTSMYIRPPVDFQGIWGSDQITLGGLGILGILMFFASAFSFFRLKEGPVNAGVSDI